MMEVLTASDSRNNEMVEGFGYIVREHGPTKLKDTPRVAEINGVIGGPDRVRNVNSYINGVIDSLTVCFKPLCGLLNQSKFIPLSYVQSLSLELELVDNAFEPIFNMGYSVRQIGETIINGYTLDTHSSDWQIEQVQAKCEMVSLDTLLQNSYTELLMDVKEIPIHYTTLVSQYQTIRNQNQPFVKVFFRFI